MLAFAVSMVCSVVAYYVLVLFRMVIALVSVLTMCVLTVTARCPVLFHHPDTRYFLVDLYHCFTYVGAPTVLYLIFMPTDSCL